MHWRTRNAAIAVASVVVAGLAIASPSSTSAASEASFEAAIDELAKARKIVRKSGNSVWKGFGTAPFGTLLVTPDYERLLCDERLPEGFQELPENKILKCEQSEGPPSWRQPNLLAAMPAFGPPSVIVMGTPEATGRSRAEWTATVFHEHFHQWQAELPDYYSRLEALDLSGGDQTGMWMINYAFPYTSPEVADAYAEASRALAATLQSDKRRFIDRREAYLKARDAFSATVNEKDWRYAEFQMWQEGVARWTEITIAERSGKADIKSAGQELRKVTIESLANPDFAGKQRVSFYALGAGEAMLLEMSGSKWRKCYAKDMALGHLHKNGCNTRG